MGSKKKAKKVTTKKKVSKKPIPKKGLGRGMPKVGPVTLPDNQPIELPAEDDFDDMEETKEVDEDEDEGLF